MEVNFVEVNSDLWAAEDSDDDMSPTPRRSAYKYDWSFNNVRQMRLQMIRAVDIETVHTLYQSYDWPPGYGETVTDPPYDESDLLGDVMVQLIDEYERLNPDDVDAWLIARERESEDDKLRRLGPLVARIHESVLRDAHARFINSDSEEEPCTQPHCGYCRPEQEI